jgi:inorganic pyrophosphatase
MLFTATRYPADYGYIQDTLGEVGDPLDALVFVGEPTFPGCRIRARRAVQDEGREVLRREDRAEIEHFFAVYKDLEGKETSTQGFGDREAALKVIQAARHRLG